MLEKILQKRVAIASSLVLAICFSSNFESANGHELHDWKAKLEKASQLEKAGKNKESQDLLISAFKELDGLAHARSDHPEALVQSLLSLSKSYRKASDLHNEYKTLIMLAAFYRFRQESETLEFADCVWHLGINCERRGAYSEALANLNLASEIYKKHPLITKEKLAKIDRGLGHVYGQTKQFSQAHKHLARSIDFSNQLIDENAHDLGRALIVKGRIYQQQKQYPEAYEAYKECVEVFRNNLRKGHLWISQALDSYIGLVKEVISESNFKSTKSDTNAADLLRQESLLRTLADAQLLNHRYYDAKKTLLNLKSIYESNKLIDRFGYANCLEDIGECCLLMRDFKAGLEFQEKAVLVYRERLSDRDSEAKALINLALLAKESGLQSKGFEYLDAAKAITSKVHGKRSYAYGECLLVEFKWLLKENKIDAIQPLLLSLGQVYESIAIPESEREKSELKQILLKLELFKRDRFHEHLWMDWERTRKAYLF